MATWLATRGTPYMKFANSNRADGYLGWGDSTRREKLHERVHPRRRVPRGTTPPMSTSTSRKTGHRGAPRAHTGMPWGRPNDVRRAQSRAMPKKKSGSGSQPGPRTGAPTCRRDRRRLGVTPPKAPSPPPAPPSRPSACRTSSPRCMCSPRTASHNRHADPLQPLHQVQEPTRRTPPVTCTATCTSGMASTDPTSMPAGHHGDAAGCSARATCPLGRLHRG